MRRVEMSRVEQDHGWFTEGFETLDLKGAKELLGELA